MKYDIITIGDATEDVFVCPQLEVTRSRTAVSGKSICFEFGEKIPLDSVQYEVGGSACNAAVGLSRLGGKVAIVCALGEDTPKQRVLEVLSEENVDQRLVTIDKNLKTSFGVIFSMDGERTIFIYHGVKDYSKLKIAKSLDAKWIFVTPLGENTDEIEKRVIEAVSEKGARFAWNPGSLQIGKGINHYKHLLKCTSVLFLNREEALKFLNFTSRPEIKDAMRKIAMYGPKIVVVTNGKEGVTAYDGKEFYQIKANMHTKRVDSTGAGDSFATGFLGRIIAENSKTIDETLVRNALEWGMANSNSVIQYVGAQKGLLTKSEIDESAKKLFE